MKTYPQLLRAEYLANMRQCAMAYREAIHPHYALGLVERGRNGVHWLECAIWWRNLARNGETRP